MSPSSMIFAEIIECRTRRHRRARTRRACFWPRRRRFRRSEPAWRRAPDRQPVARHATFDQHRDDFLRAAFGTPPDLTPAFPTSSAYPTTRSSSSPLLSKRASSSRPAFAAAGSTRVPCWVKKRRNGRSADAASVARRGVRRAADPATPSDCSNSDCTRASRAWARSRYSPALLCVIVTVITSRSTR